MSDLPRDLRIKAGMIMMCERIPFGSDAALMEMAANEIEQLQQRNAELEAQVARLNQRNNELEVMQPSYNLLRNAFYDGACWNESTINNGALSLDKNAHEYANEKLAELTPAQCLAERDREVAAMAVEKAIQSALLTYGDSDLTPEEIKRLSNGYANKIKSGEVEI